MSSLSFQIYKDGNKVINNSHTLLTFESKGLVLNIESVSHLDMGEYRCSIFTTVGFRKAPEISKITFLSVKGMFIIIA